MFTQLLESKRQTKRSVSGYLFSAVVHTIIIAAAVYVTATAGIADEGPKEEKIQFVEVKKEEPPPQKEEPPPPKDVVVAPPPPKGFQVLQAPVEIPAVIPEIDLTKKVTDEADFSGKGVKGGIARGVVGATGPVTDQPYFEFQVEKQVMPQEGNPRPVYPEVLRSSSVEGAVTAQFTVDTTGRAEMGSFKTLSSSNDLFTASVRSALSRMRFYPAEIGGRKVRQLVQQEFKFNLSR